jgi:hypothetical protein
VTWLADLLGRVVAIREALDIGDADYAAELARDLEADPARQGAAELAGGEPSVGPPLDMTIGAPRA